MARMNQPSRGEIEPADPSGHGKQVMPRQQDELSKSNDHAPNATGEGEDGREGRTVIDEETLEDLKGE